LGSLWEIPKGYRKAAGKCPNICKQPKERRENFPVAIGKNVAISIPFL
jgi:hypothetical protein